MEEEGGTMPRTLKEIFTDNPGVKELLVVGYNDGGPFGPSEGGRKLKILDNFFARELANLPGANTDTGHITEEGYCVHGHYDIHGDSYKASVNR